MADAPREGGGSWNRDGTILFVPDYAKGIYQVSASGRTPAPVILPDTSKSWFYAGPRFLPDGEHFLYVTALVTLHWPGPISPPWMAKKDAWC